MAPDPSRLGIYALDVGQGDCTFIVPPAGEGDPILFDCADAYVAERFVASHGFRRLHAVIASHLDRDHIRGLLPFLRAHFAGGGEVGSLVIGVDRPPGPDGAGAEIAALLEQALAWADAPPCAGFALADPTRGAAPKLLAAGPGWTVELVLPRYAARLAATGLGGEDPNACSAVLRVSRAGVSVLVGGDAPLAAWEGLEPELLPAAAVRVPHHGGGMPLGERFADAAALYGAIGASRALVSVGTRNAYGHPAQAHVVAAGRGGACRVRCTQLTPRCHPDPEAHRSEALRLAAGVLSPYRHRSEAGHPSRRPEAETPCAGSMVVWIDAAGQLDGEPRPRGPHDRFIAKLATPLCELR